MASARSALASTVLRREGLRGMASSLRVWFTDNLRKRIVSPKSKLGIVAGDVCGDCFPTCRLIKLFNGLHNLRLITARQAFNDEKTFFAGLIGIAKVLNQIKAKIARVVIAEMSIRPCHMSVLLHAMSVATARRVP